MTRRGCLGIGVLTVALIAVVALVVRPVLSHHTPSPTSLASPRLIVVSQPPGLTPLAERAARQALACPAVTHGPRSVVTPPAQTRWCGGFTVTRHQASCPVLSRCQVELVGTLRTTGGARLIALSVTMRLTSAGWRPVEVTS
jgi:hypothetical protein